MVEAFFYAAHRAIRECIGTCFYRDVIALPHYFDETELRRATERAWGVSFSKEDEKGHLVKESGSIALVYAKPHLLCILSESQPYFARDPKEYATSLSQPQQQKAWAEHSAWTSIDYVRGGADRELEYSVLAKLAAEMIDSNCTGVYIPGEKSFIPNEGLIVGELRRIAAARLGPPL